MKEPPPDTLGGETNVLDPVETEGAEEECLDNNLKKCSLTKMAQIRLLHGLQ